jgi:enoyl-CoA hydratase/carnithine racemase
VSSGLSISRCGDAHVFLLNRPERGNGLSPSLVEAFHDGLDEVERVNGRLLLVQGEGRNFCTGFDLEDITAMTDADLLLRFVRIEQLLARLWAAPYSTVAVGKGRVFGAGADLFAACSRRLALPDSTYGFPGAAFGLVLGTRRLSVRVGEAAALHLITSGAVVDAEAALRLGLATTLLDSADLKSVLENQIAIATRLDPVTYQAVRKAVGTEAGRLDSDLAALVRSAARRGLRQKMVEFRTRALEAHRTGALNAKHNGTPERKTY